MSEIYTAEDLIRYIYQETSVKENQEIMEQLLNNPAFMAEYLSMKETLSALSEAELDPDPASVSIILEHSQNQHEVHN